MTDEDHFTIKEYVQMIHDRVEKLDEKVDEVLPTVAQTRDHEARLRKVERRVWALPAAGIGVAGSVIVALIQSGTI